MADQEIPLFPLNVVLFPEMILPLHIFEPRYVRMVRECFANDQAFGVVLIREDEHGNQLPCEVGTAARIRELNEVQPNRFMLLTVGERRFRIAELIDRDERLFAKVEYFDDDPATNAGIGDLVEEVRSLSLEQLRLVQEARGRPATEETIPQDPVLLSFFLAAGVQLPLTERQQLLESNDTGSRLRPVRDALTRQIEKLTHRREIHAAAEQTRGSNGKLGHEHYPKDILQQFDGQQ